MLELYTNSKSRDDFIKPGISSKIEKDMDIFIASAFFTEHEIISEMIEKGCHIRIIVRLGFPTSPAALKMLINNNVEARFFTGNSFHPKIYIIGDKAAFIGSANLTRAALLSNQEVVLSVTSEDLEFNELNSIFNDYWNDAQVLDKNAINKYSKIYNKHKEISSKIKSMDDSICQDIGIFEFSNINRGKKKKNKKTIFLDSYKKSYQESCSAFKRIKDEYSLSKRKVSEDIIPLHLEIDSFFSFVRDKHAIKDTWELQPLDWNTQKLKLKDLITEWHSIYWEHFEDRIIHQNYPLIKKTFSSKETIKNSSINDIVNTLCVLHSFHDSLRFHKGGLESLKSNFIKNNEEEKVKNTLSYLLFGNDELIVRMANCIYDNDYKLNHFGQANVQELIGWINKEKEDYPVINGRTTKILRYFGFDVRQL
ncbi:phospholipase D-like domain-containing protein [Edwardsiella tarda]|uniref:phospholipase D-like domain-containing protein n=1 Tax=Edwardsiella tarda TaxID=636 RepID=UPI003F65EF19